MSTKSDVGVQYQMKMMKIVRNGRKLYVFNNLTIIILFEELT
jgi:hypothetical protein